MANHLKVGQLAERVQVHLQTIHYHESGRGCSPSGLGLPGFPVRRCAESAVRQTCAGAGLLPERDQGATLDPDASGYEESARQAGHGMSGPGR